MKLVMKWSVTSQGKLLRVCLETTVRYDSIWDYYASQPKDHPPPNPKHKSDGDPVFGFRGSVKKVCICT